MAAPVQVVVENVSTPTQGYLAIQVRQKGEVLSSSTIHYPRQGEIVIEPGDADEMDLRAETLNDLLGGFNAQLTRWCT